MACIEALSPAPSASTRMQISRASTILSTRARVSDSAWARASAGRAATSSRVCRQAREASPYWRSQSFCASRWASRTLLPGDARAFLGRERRRLEAAGLGRRAPRRRPALAGLGGRGGAPPDVPSASLAAALAERFAAAVRAPPSSRERSLSCGLQRTRARPSERIVASCAGVVMRKLLSGNGCDIQPTSRCTNIPTRSAWTSISGVMVLVAAFMGWRPAGDGRQGLRCYRRPGAGLEPPRRGRRRPSA